MSLTPHDLIHGGLYRRKRNHSVIGQAEFDLEFGKIWINANGITYSLGDEWEPIPLTPEILREWFGFAFRDFEYYGEYRKGKVSIVVWNGQYQIGIAREVTLKSVHDLQRLHLALTGKPLEGGPK